MLTPEIRAIWNYPCLCLCRGFEQITRTRPWRRMILHFSHIGLTDGRTFTLFALYVSISSIRRPGSGDRDGRRYRAAEHAARKHALRAHRGMLATRRGAPPPDGPPLPPPRHKRRAATETAGLG